LEAERNRDKPDGDEIQKSMMAAPSSNQGGANTKSKGTSMPWRTPSMGKRDGFRKPNMSASGQKAKYSRRANNFRCYPNNGHSPG